MSVKRVLVQVAWLFKVVIALLLFSGVLGFLWMSYLSTKPLPSGGHPNHTEEPAISPLALRFVPNAGQTAAPVQFQAHSRVGTLFFTPEAVVVTLPAPAARVALNDDAFVLPVRSNPAARVVRLQFVDANPHPHIVGNQQQTGVVHYLRGNNPDEWHTDLATYAEVIYQQLYPGIDLHYDGSEGLLKGTYVVAPDADPDHIRWRYTGIDNLEIDTATGDLLITMAGDGTLTEKAPIAWQDIAGHRVSVDVHYTIDADETVRLAVGAYDNSVPLIIDPTLEYSSYLGGDGNDFGGILERDDTNGDLYIAGRTESTNFPGVNVGLDSTLDGDEDGFVTKLDANGQVQYSTYFGGSADDFLYGFVRDSTGHLYISGETTSTDLPGVDIDDRLNGESDGFVARLEPDGNGLDFSVYLGGSATDTASGLAVDSTDRVYVVGRTTSTDFPTVNPLQADNAGGFDFIVARLSTTGVLEYSTYLGGSGNENRRDGGIALNAADEIYVFGATSSTDFPTTSGVYQEENAGGVDLFVTKLNTAGSSILFSSYIGGTGNDQTAAFGAHSMKLDTAGNIYLTGLSLSTDFPTTPGAAQPTFGGPNFDGIVVKLAPDGSHLLFSTYLGGSQVGGNGNDFMSGIAVDPAGNVYVTGHVHSIDFPIKNAIQPNSIGSSASADANITKLKPDGSLDYSTFFGGSFNEWGHDIEVDDNGTAYVLLYTASDDVLLITPDAFQSMSGGEIDIVIAEVSSVLQVDKVGSPLVAEASGPISYTLVVENSSPQPISNVVLTDTLPLDMNVTNVMTNGLVMCTTSEPVPNVDQVLCPIGNLAAGETVSITLDVTAPATVGPPLDNEAVVTALHPDPTLGDLTYVVTETTFFDAADLSVEVVAPNPDPNLAGDVGTGSTLTYPITVTNTGPDIATSVVLTTTLADGMSFVNTEPPDANCTETSGVVTCDMGTLAVNEHTNVSIVATAPETRGSFQTGLSVTSSVPDQDNTNNTAAASNFAEVYDAEVVVVDTVVSGPPTVFTHTLQLTNTSTWFATFDILVADNTWTTLVSPTEIVALEYRSPPNFDPTTSIEVIVTAPEIIGGEPSDTATISVVPRAGTDQVASVEIISTIETVQSLTRSGGSPTNADIISYTLTFNGPMTGLIASNFELTTNGTLSGVSITDVSTSDGGTTWIITVDTGTGDGIIGLALVNDTGLSNPVNSLPSAAPDTEVDTAIPDSPVVTSPTTPQTTEANTFTIMGTAEAGSLVQVFASDTTVGEQRVLVSDTLVGEQQLGADDSSFSITVALNEGTNDFTVTVTDAAGNLSTVTTVPTITREPTTPTGDTILFLPFVGQQ